MAEVILGLKVMPKDLNVDIDQLEQKIKSEINPERIQRQPIAFGLVALLITVFVQDAEGEVDRVENKIRSIENVGEVEVTGLTRSL
jgi:elongation factor 1-beta